jgi:HEPN domain-containing protein/predicted nucleotidyltransferase
MLRTVDDVIHRVVGAYKPDRIILYGSHARGMAGEDSDIDILIVKETDERPAKRRMEVEKFLADRELPIDITVYTPQEIRYLFSIGSPFISEIIKEGKVVYMRKVTESWLKDTQDELETAWILFENGKYRGACYHSQQCVEKGLKALILERGKTPGRMHDIVELLNKTEELGWDLPLSMDDAIFLNSIYKGRYPTEEGLLPYGEPTKEDAQKALAASKSLMGRINASLK